MQPSSLNLVKDKNGENTFGLYPTDFKYATSLVASVEQTLTITGENAEWLAIFSIEPGAKVWVAINETATLPGGSFALTDSELNPVARRVKANDVLHFITIDANIELGVILYGI